MSFKLKTIVFYSFLIIPFVIMSFIFAKYIYWLFIVAFFIWIPFVIIMFIRINRHKMDPNKSFALVGPVNESGNFFLPFIHNNLILFAKRFEVPSGLSCSMCHNIINTRESQFYVLFDKSLDSPEMFLHKECIELFAKIFKKDFKRDLTSINLNEKVQKSEKYTNMVHLINLGTERKLDLYLLDYEPKFSRNFQFHFSDFHPMIFTYEEFGRYLMDTFQETEAEIAEINDLNVLKKKDRSMRSYYKNRLKSLKKHKKTLQKELIKVRTYKKHYYPLSERLDTPPRSVWTHVHVEVPDFCSVCGRQFIATDEVLMLYIPQKKKFEAFLHLQCKKYDDLTRTIFKWNSHEEKEYSFNYEVKQKKIKGIKKFDDCLILETRDNLRELMFGNVAVPGKTIVMVEDNTCVCDMDCNCNCNCNCGE